MTNEVLKDEILKDKQLDAVAGGIDIPFVPPDFKPFISVPVEIKNRPPAFE